MRTTVMKCACVVLLLATVLFWRPIEGVHVLINSAICAGAIIVLVQAAAVKKTYWVAAFATVAIVFNPLAPVSVSALLSPYAAGFAIAVFVASIFALKSRPRLSVPSITDRTPGSLSL